MNTLQILVLFVYLSGIVPGYCAYKSDFRRFGWTKEMRREALLMASISWISVLCKIIGEWIDSGGKEKASW
jgi:hypothetical protein